MQRKLSVLKRSTDSLSSGAFVGIDEFRSGVEPSVPGEQERSRMLSRDRDGCQLVTSFRPLEGLQSNPCVIPEQHILDPAMLLRQLRQRKNLILMPNGSNSPSKPFAPPPVTPRPHRPGSTNQNPSRWSQTAAGVAVSTVSPTYEQTPRQQVKQLVPSHAIIPSGGTKDGRPVTRQKQPKDALDLFGETKRTDTELFPSRSRPVKKGTVGPVVPTVNFSCLFVNNDDEFAPLMFPTRRRGSGDDIPLIETDWSDFTRQRTPRATTLQQQSHQKKEWVEISIAPSSGTSHVEKDSSDDEMEEADSVRRIHSLYDLLVAQKGGVGKSPTNGHSPTQVVVTSLHTQKKQQRLNY